MRVALVSTPFATTRMPPLSLALLSACLKREGHAVACFDLNLELFRRSGRRDLFAYAAGHRWKDRAAWDAMMREDFGPFMPRLLYELTLYQPGFVGISAWHAPFAELVAASVKALDRRIPVVVGGPLASRAFGPLSMKPSPNLDAIVSGEGESVLPALVRRFEVGGTLAPLPGVVVHDQGYLHDGGPEHPVADLDALPDADFGGFDLPAYDDADFGGGVAFPLLHVRGCPAACAFCNDRAMWGGAPRLRSPARTADEAERQVGRHGAKHFVFLDLAVNPTDAQLAALAEELAGRALAADFCAMARFSAGFADPAFVARLAAARFVHFTFGLESGSDALLGRMGKPHRCAAASAALERLEAAGILASVNLIAGFPGESEDDVDETIAFVRRHASRIWSAPSVAVCAVPPSSRLATEADRFGVVLDPRDPEAHERWTAPGNDPGVRRVRRDRMLSAFAGMRFKKDLQTRPPFVMDEQSRDSRR